MVIKRDVYIDPDRLAAGGTGGSYALASNVLALDNTTAFTPDADYEPATKKYVDDNAGGGGVSVADIGSTAETVGGAVDNGTAATAARSDHKHAITSPKLDDLAATDDNTDLNATTTSHGLLLKAVAPAANLMNVVGIVNGETAYANKALFDATSPADVGTASAGTSTIAAHRDHVHAIPNNHVAYAKIQQVSATDKILGRSSAGAGNVEEITCTAAGRALLDDVDAAAQLVTLGITGTGIPADGWVSANETWTYASASTFTVSGDVSGKYGKGDKIKWTQTTVKYGNIISAVYSSPNTTVTIAVNLDHVITNAAISANYYSKVANPQGFPSFFYFTPLIYGYSSNPTGGTYTYTITGNSCTITIFEPNNGTSNANYIVMTVPVSSASNSAATFQSVGSGVGFDNNAVVSTPSLIFIAQSESALSIHKTFGALYGWTASGSKKIAYGTITYPI